MFKPTIRTNQTGSATTVVAILYTMVYAIILITSRKHARFVESKQRVVWLIVVYVTKSITKSVWKTTSTTKSSPSRTSSSALYFYWISFLSTRSTGVIHVKNMMIQTCFWIASIVNVVIIEHASQTTPWSSPPSILCMLSLDLLIAVLDALFTLVCLSLCCSLF